MIDLLCGSADDFIVNNFYCKIFLISMFVLCTMHISMIFEEYEFLKLVGRVRL